MALTHLIYVLLQLIKAILYSDEYDADKRKRLHLAMWDPVRQIKLALSQLLSTRIINI